MAEDNSIQRYIEQMYEDEGLTDSLTDPEAQVLLAWGEQQLKSLAFLAGRPDQLDDVIHQLFRMLRTMNRFLGQKAELSETQIIHRLFRLVEQAMHFSQQKSLIKGTGPTGKGAEDDQETDPHYQ